MHHNSEQATALRDKIFTSSYEQKFFTWYRSFFSIGEIENAKILWFAWGALLFSFYTTFYGWIGNSVLTVQSFLSNRHECWPYFLDCGKYHILEALPYGYSQTIFYVFLFALMALVAFFMFKKDWVLAHMVFSILWLWKFSVVFILSHGASGNYDYYDVLLAFVLLFLPHKVFFLKLSFVVFYFLSSTIKIHEGWILGTYFTSLKTGLPIFRDAFAPIATNLVIIMQIVGVWFLLSANKIRQRVAFSYFLLFHLYSGILVEYRYLASTIPILLTLYGPMYEKTPVPLDRKSLAGWLMITILFIIQFIPILAIRGDQKMTLEGNYYGFYMFEANHQCVYTITEVYKDGTSKVKSEESILARARCAPFKTWFAIQQSCERQAETLERVDLIFDHSINGGPFYRIINERNVCALDYHPFLHNDWIKTPQEGAPIIGYPVKNIFY